MDKKLERQLIIVGAYIGFAVVLLYFFVLANILPIKIAQTIALCLGPMQMINSLGIYYFIRYHKETIFARYGLLFVIIGGVSFTVMLVTQFSVGTFVQDFKVDYPDLKDSLRAAAGMGNIIQLGLDIVFDFFISLGTAMFAIALFHVKSFPKWLAGIGAFISIFGLSLNLYTFPYPPAESGLFDPGPFYGLFKLALSIIIVIQMTKLRKLEAH